MFAPVYALLLLRAGLLAALSSLPGTPVGGASLCPTPDALRRELGSLLTQAEIQTHLPSSVDEPPIRIEDLGPSFRVSLRGREREYRDEGRDCARRARIGALFAALVIDPSARVPPEPTPMPRPPSPAVPPPGLKASPQPPSIPAPEPTRAAQATARLEGAAAMTGGADGQAWAPAWGGAIRLGVGSGTMALVLGLGAFWPADTAIGGIRLRQWRMPVDMGLRATASTRNLSLYGELGLVTAVLRERAIDLSTRRSGTALELGGRFSVGARWSSSGTVAPFLAASLDVIPDAPTIVALPAGDAGRTSRWWLSACLGVSWGIR